MKTLQLNIILLLLTCISLRAQEKTVVGDTGFVYKYHLPLIEKLNLINLKNENSNEIYRIWRYGSVIELIKANEEIQGYLTCYTYRYNRGYKQRLDTVHTKYELQYFESDSILKIIHNSCLQEVPVQYDYGNRHVDCMDCPSELIEHADSSTYYVRKYNSYELRNIENSINIKELLKSIDSLSFVRKYNKRFLGNLRKDRYYKNSERSIVFGGHNRAYTIGYEGSSNLPFGLLFLYHQEYLKNTRIDMAIGASGYTNFNSQLDFEFMVGRNMKLANWKFTKNDELWFSARNRISNSQEILLYKMNYSFHPFKTRLGFGVSQRTTITKLNAPNFKIGKSFPLFGTRFYSEADVSFYRGDTDYAIGIHKKIQFNRYRLPNAIHLGLVFEKLYNINEINFSISTTL